MSAKFYNANLCLIIITTGMLLPTIYATQIITISDEFGTTKNAIQYGIAICLLGNALTAPLFGAFSDDWGRKKTLNVAGIICILGCFICAVSYDVTTFQIGRLLQGLGAGAFSVVTTASIQDIRTPTEAAKVMGWTSVFAAPAPIISPYIGEHLTMIGGWRFMFVIAAVWIAVLMWGLRMMLETAPKRPKATQSSHMFHLVVQQSLAALKSYKKILSSPKYIVFALQSPLLICGFWCAISTYPVYFPMMFNITKAQYTANSLYLAIFYLIGQFFLSRSINAIGLERTLALGLKVAVCAGCVHFLVAGVLSSEMAWTFIILGAYMIGMSLAFSPSVSKSISLFEDDKGCAAAVSNSLRKIMSAFGAYLAGVFDDSSLVPTSIIMISVSVVALLLFQLRKTKFILS